MTDRFSNYAVQLDSVATNAFVITPSSNTLAISTRSIYVGGAGDITVLPVGYKQETPVAITFTAVPAGTILPIRVSVVYANTIATNLLGLY